MVAHADGHYAAGFAAPASQDAQPRSPFYTPRHAHLKSPPLQASQAPSPAPSTAAQDVVGASRTPAPAPAAKLADAVPGPEGKDAVYYRLGWVVHVCLTDGKDAALCQVPCGLSRDPEDVRLSGRTCLASRALEQWSHI